MRAGISSARLTEHLDAERRRVEAALERAVAALEKTLPPAVSAAARHGVLGSGKRLRPILCVSAYQACARTPSSAVYDLAAALELIHAYSLMHDDLPCMDDADLRRGRPTTHREHGEDAAMRAGAVLIPAAALHALEACRRLGCGPARTRAILDTLLEAAGAGGMVGGQWVDLLGEGTTLGKEELDELHARKTGALLAASLVTGALAADASDGVVDRLHRYGRAVGLAFQITDDILDATESAETLGKNPSDVALDKSTYVALHGLEEARLRAHEEVERAVSALREAGLDAPMLVALAHHVVERDR